MQSASRSYYTRSMLQYSQRVSPRLFQSTTTVVTKFYPENSRLRGGRTRTTTLQLSEEREESVRLESDSFWLESYSIHLKYQLTTPLLMIGFQQKKRRFTLFHLDQSQTFIQDFIATCLFNDQPPRKGRFYLCSKSLVYESDNPADSILKLAYQHMSEAPRIRANKNEESIVFVVNRVVQIKTQGPPQPFILKDMKSEVSVLPTYSDSRKLKGWMEQLWGLSKNKKILDLQKHVYEMVQRKENKRTFNMSLIESVSQKSIIEDTQVFARRVLPLNQIMGFVFLTQARVYFEPLYPLSNQPVKKIPIRKMSKLFKRRFQLSNIGLQLILDEKSYYFAFENQDKRDLIFNALMKIAPDSCFRQESLQHITYLWQKREISNYQYLMHLNHAGNRSFCDLSQYPVFPWVISDYVSQQIDLDDPSVFRDLTKPLGALDEQRLERFIERYQNMDEPKFLYGSHYSAPGYVIGYLVRKHPQYMLKLQSGKFDKPDRLFKSIKGDWKNVTKNPTSVKQLIPEFYQDDQNFLKNSLKLDLGVRQNLKRVGDVKLPKWAKDPNHFLETNREALESEFVSNNLHHWIDLIFGYKQRGLEAIRSNNVFHHYSYEGMVKLEQIQSEMQKLARRTQINQFGQCPKQIFKIPHPPRNAQVQTPKYSSLLPQDVKQIYSEVGTKIKMAISLERKGELSVEESVKVHKQSVMRVLLMQKQEQVITLGQDGFLKVVDLITKNTLKSFKITEFCLSCAAVVKEDEVYAVGSWDNKLYLFNLVYGSKYKTLDAHDNSLSDLIFLKRYNLLVSSSLDCTIKLWKCSGTQLSFDDVLKDHQSQIMAVAAAPDETLISYGDSQGGVFGVRVISKQTVFRTNMRNERVCRLLFVKTNFMVACGQFEIVLCDSLGNTLTKFFIDKPNGKIVDAAIDDSHLFVITENKHLALYDLLQQKKVGHLFNDLRLRNQDTMPNQKSLACLGLGKSGKMLVLGTEKGNVRLVSSAQM